MRAFTERGHRSALVLLFVTSLFGASAAADPLNPITTKTAYTPRDDIRFQQQGRTPGEDLANSAPFVFTAPPRGSRSEEESVYKPIADYLTKVTGHKFVYKFSDNWLTYSKEMTLGDYDLVFDGPHFNGWREDKLKHVPLVKLAEPFVFVVVARDDDKNIKNMASLAGRTVCAHAPPNLGTLTLLNQFSNPARQPYIIETNGWKKNYEALVAGKCEATVLPLTNYRRFEGDRHATHIVYRNRALPNNAFSAGPRIPAAMQVQIAQALLSPEGQEVTAKLRHTYASKALVAATPQEYEGLGSLLKDTLYYQY